MRGTNKYLMVGLAMLFAVGSIVIGMNYSSRRNPQATTEKTPKTEKKASTKKGPKKEAEVLFLDDKHIFLTEDITDAYVEVVASKIDQKDEEDVALFEQGKVKWTIQKGLNELFTQPVLVGDRVVDNVTYKDTATENKKAIVLDTLKESGLKDDFATTVLTILGEKPKSKTETSTSTSQTADLTLIAPNPTDSQDVQTAKTQLSYVVQNGEVVPGFTMEGYDLAKSAIAALPADDVKQALVSQLRIVETAMTNMGISFEAYNEGF